MIYLLFIPTINGNYRDYTIAKANVSLTFMYQVLRCFAKFALSQFVPIFIKIKMHFNLFCKLSMSCRKYLTLTDNFRVMRKRHN